MNYSMLLLILGLLIFAYRYQIWNGRKKHEKFIKEHINLSEDSIHIIDYMNKQSERIEGDLFEFAILILAMLIILFN